MPTRATLLGSAVSDLNVMTRRGAWRHVVTPVEGHAHEGFERTTTTSTVLWLCHRGRVDIAGPAGAARLGRLDAWLVEPSSPAVWRIAPQDDVELFLIELDRGEAVKADE